MLLASALCLLVVMGWMQYLKWTMPPQLPTTGPAATQRADDSPTPRAGTGDPIGDPAAPVISAGRYRATESTQTGAVVIGDDRPDADNPYRMQIEIDPRGASIRTLTLTDHRQKVRRKKTDPLPPAYRLLDQVTTKEATYQSFVARTLRLPDIGVEVALDDIIWSIEPHDDAKVHGVRLWTRILEDGIEILELSRFIRLPAESRHFEMDWHIANLSDRPMRVLLTDTGPTGIQPSDQRYDKTRVMIAEIDAQSLVSAGEHDVRDQVIKSEDHRRDFKPGDEHLYWVALSNKYFTCLMFPKPLDAKSNYARYVDRVSAIVHEPRLEALQGDLSIEQVLAPTSPIMPGKPVIMSFDVYCGDKSEASFASVPDASSRRYGLVMSPDKSACTFESIGQVLAWLLGIVHAVVGNYGVAIILLVIVVRGLLHPITKKGQVNMMRMQKNQQRLKPKLEAIQKQYKNDKQKLGEETMKLYREEGISPASTLSGCVPMLLQTPIWIALYTLLNTDVALRHEPFFWYIRDLSAPDELIDFGWSFQIPIIGAIMGPISALNVLPIIMAVVMWGQMKLSQKLAKSSKAAEQGKAETPPDPNAAPDAMAMQQKMMGFMMPLFGLMFYNMPSGLCLYILSNSLLGMGELHFIRKQLKEEDEKGVFEKLHKPKKKKGWFITWFEEMQKKAELAKQGRLPGPPQKGKGRKKPRF